MKKFLLSMAAAACCTMAVSAQGLYATGNFEASNWNPKAPVEFEFDGTTYKATIEGVSMFKMSTVKPGEEVEGSGWDEFNEAGICLAAADGMCVVGDNALIATAGDIMLPWTGDWTFEVSADLTTMKASTTTPEPVGFEKVYVRGGMNSWGVSEDWEMKTTDGVLYTLDNFEVAPGVEFKIANEGWSTINYGMAENEMVYPEVPFEAVFNSQTNIQVAVPCSGTLYLDLDNKMIQIGGEYSSVKGLASDNAAAVYYNMQGVRVSEPANGMYIVRRGNTVTKEVVRK